MHKFERGQFLNDPGLQSILDEYLDKNSGGHENSALEKFTISEYQWIRQGNSIIVIFSCSQGDISKIKNVFKLFQDMVVNDNIISLKFDASMESTVDAIIQSRFDITQ